MRLELDAVVYSAMAIGELKTLLRPIYADSLVWDLYQRRRSKIAIDHWKQNGRPAPPPHAIKVQVVKTYALQFQTKTLVETGTFFGDMLYGTRRLFKRLISIELSKDLSERAKQRFRNFSNIKILQGDSGELLPTILRDITEPCLFWLDGHYSGGVTAKASLATPIVDELRAIFEHPVRDHVVLIDDARLFDGTEDYPKIEEFTEFVQRNRPDFEISVVHDVIRIHPRREGLHLES